MPVAESARYQHASLGIACLPRERWQEYLELRGRFHDVRMQVWCSYAGMVELRMLLGQALADNG